MYFSRIYGTFRLSKYRFVTKNVSKQNKIYYVSKNSKKFIFETTQDISSFQFGLQIVIFNLQSLIYLFVPQYDVPETEKNKLFHQIFLCMLVMPKYQVNAKSVTWLCQEFVKNGNSIDLNRETAKLQMPFI